MLVVEPNPDSTIVEKIRQYQGLGQRAFVLTENVAEGAACSFRIATFADFAQNVMPDIKWLDDYKRLRAFEDKLKDAERVENSGRGVMEQPRVIGHVVSVNGFRLKVELSSEAKSSSRATPDGVQRAVAINAFLTFDLGAGTYAIGVFPDLEARESYDPTGDDELTLQLTKPRRVASIQLLGTVRQAAKGQLEIRYRHHRPSYAGYAGRSREPGDTSLRIWAAAAAQSVRTAWTDGHGAYDYALEIGHQTGDENTPVKASFNDLFSRPLAIVGNTGSGKSYTVTSLLRSVNRECRRSERRSEPDPHIFILDINGEYAQRLPAEGRRQTYVREPNEAYINGKKASLPHHFMADEFRRSLRMAEQLRNRRSSPF